MTTPIDRESVGQALAELEAHCEALHENARRAGKEGAGTHRNHGDAGQVAALWIEACQERDALRAALLGAAPLNEGSEEENPDV